MYQNIVSLQNLFWSWKEFLKGKRNRCDVREFGYRLEDNIFALHEQLEAGLWEHGEYERFSVCDPKPRIIHKASVADRLVHHAVYNELVSIFEPSFIFDSYSCRVGKGTHRAVERLVGWLQEAWRENRGDVWIIKCDVRKYFASIDQEVLLELLAEKIHDVRALSLVEKIVRSYSPGLPLGNLTSQLFANVYLNPFDHFVKEQMRCKRYMRYCDDFVIVNSSPKELLSFARDCQYFLRSQLRISLHPHKIQLRPFHHGVDWLGYTLYPSGILLRTTTRRRALRRVVSTARKVIAGKEKDCTLTSCLNSYRTILTHTTTTDLIHYMDMLGKCI